MPGFNVRILTSNVHGLSRITSLLRNTTVIDTDYSGHRHTTRIEVSYLDGTILHTSVSSCADPDIREGEINALVREVHQRGAASSDLPELVYGLAARLLDAVEISDPHTDEPLSGSRALELAEQLDGEDQGIRGDLPVRQWVATHVLRACERIVDYWTSILDSHVESITQAHGAPTPTWYRADAEHQIALELWPSALQQVRAWLSAIK